MLRTRLAERVAPLKKRLAIKTPVLDEIPLRAELPLSFELPFPRIRGIVPVVVQGKAFGKVAGRWYRVVFPRPIVDPSVVCVGEARRTELPRPTMREIVLPAIERIPRIEIPAVEEIPALEKIKHMEIPVIDIKVPNWTLHIPTVDDFINLIKRFLGDWGWLNSIRDAIAWAIGNWEYWLWNLFFRPRFIEKLNEEVLKPLRETLTNMRNRVNEKIEEINARFDEALDKVDAGLEQLRSNVQDRLDTLQSEANEAVDTLRMRVEARLDTLRSNAQARVNEAIQRIPEDLYDAWGIPHIMALTPLHIRNVTSTGFEFQSFGQTTCYYLAVGRRR